MTDTVKLEQVISPYYCKLALLLCQHARELLNDDSTSAQASKICRYISTLCVKNDCEFCVEESHLCSKVSDYCLKAETVEEAKKTCETARRQCPKSFSLYGG